MVVLNAIDVFVGEFLRRDVSDARTFFVCHDELTDRVQEMRLAQAHAAIKEQWIIGFARRLGDRQRRGVCEAVIVSNDESVECVFRVESMIAAGGGVVGGGSPAPKSTRGASETLARMAGLVPTMSGIGVSRG